MKSKKLTFVTVVIGLSVLITGCLFTGCLSTWETQEPQINKEDTTMPEPIEESGLETIMLEYIEEDILDGYEPVNHDEAVKILNQMVVGGITDNDFLGQKYTSKEIIQTSQDLQAIVVPEFLPERFIARGVFAKDNLGITGTKVLMYLWYDPENLEVLMVWPGRYSYDYNEEELFRLGNYDEIGRRMNEISPWINYSASYRYAQDGIGVHGLMFLNSKDNFNECEKILESLKR